MRASQGVSLVELVVIVTMIGIVAAFAIPRFTHLQNDVRASEVVALSASLRSVSEAAHTQFVKSGASSSTIKMAGKMVRLKNGYPDASSFGIQRVVADVTEFRTSSAENSVTFSKLDAVSSDECGVTYHAATDKSPASVNDLKTGGC